MVNFPFVPPASCDAQTPQRPGTSSPAWSTPTSSMSPPPLPPPRTPQTPQSGRSRKPRLSGARASPYMAPERATLGDGSPIKLFTPKQLVEQKKKEAQQRRASAGTYSPSPRSMGPPTQRRAASSTDTPTRTRPRTPLFPQGLRVRTSTPRLAPAAVILGTPRPDRRLQDPAVQLLQILSKCVSVDNQRNTQWTMTNELLNKRNDDRDNSGMWNPLSSIIRIVWPDLTKWIMDYTPLQDNVDWFMRIGRSGDDDNYIDERLFASMHSSLDRVGFRMSATAYNAACEIIRVHVKRGKNPQCLWDSGINPFFILYVSVDCNLRLPDNFSQQLFWKHLDAIIHAQCWRGLGSNRDSGSTSSGAATVTPNFSFEEEDPEKILPRLLSLSHGGRSFAPAPAPVPAPAPAVHPVYISIAEYEWDVKAPTGSFKYVAGDLDEKDVASFAVIDALTRVLPHCQGGTLEIRTNDVRLLWGAYGAPAGAWLVVRAVCESYGVGLVAKWAELTRKFGWAPVDSSESAPVPPRDSVVVMAVLDRLMGLEGNDAYDRMVRHLTRVTGQK